jgi:hypothetical protein
MVEIPSVVGFPEALGGSGGQVGRMLITLASTTTRTPKEISDCIAISALARMVNGIVSVGLKATALVNARYRWSAKRGRQPGAASPLVMV